MVWEHHMGSLCFSGTVTTLLGDGQAITVTAIGAASILGAPVLEEYTYRGFLLPSLTKWMQTPAAVIPPHYHNFDSL